MKNKTRTEKNRMSGMKCGDINIYIHELKISDWRVMKIDKHDNRRINPVTTENRSKATVHC